MFITYKFFSKKFAPKDRADGLEYGSSMARYVATMSDLLVMVLLCKMIYFILAIFPNDWFFMPDNIVNKMKFGFDLTANEIQTVKLMRYKIIATQFIILSCIGSTFAASLYWLGGSIGAIMFGLRVVNDKDGSRLSLKTCIARTFFTLATVATFMVGFFISFFSKKRQTLHDKLAKTVVVTKKSLKEQGLYNPRFDPFDKYVWPYLLKIFVKVKALRTSK